MYPACDLVCCAGAEFAYANEIFLSSLNARDLSSGPLERREALFPVIIQYNQCCTVPNIINIIDLAILLSFSALVVYR